MLRLAPLFLCLALIGTALQADKTAQKNGCQRHNFEGHRLTLCRFAMPSVNVTMHLKQADGQIIGSFLALKRLLTKQGKTLLMAMNGGMYHPDRRPVGLYIEQGRQVMRAIPNAGPGNFGLLPNGVFCISRSRARIIETLRYLKEKPQCDYATQSGPMLVIDGALHPKFIAESRSKYLRNGVGIDKIGQELFFVIADNAINFHSFARFFRDYLRATQALYLDGNISKLYAPDIGRVDLGFPMGPMIAVTAK